MKQLPVFKLSRLFGRITRSRFLLKEQPGAKVRRLLGRATSAKLELDFVSKGQALKALWEKVQTICVFCTCHQSDPFQAKVCIGNLESLLLDRTPCSIQIHRNTSAREFRSLAHNILLSQALIQEQLRITVVQCEFSPFPWWHLPNPSAAAKLSQVS